MELRTQPQTNYRAGGGGGGGACGVINGVLVSLGRGCQSTYELWFRWACVSHLTTGMGVGWGPDYY